jgi:outer membrane protein assembly factor BamB
MTCEASSGYRVVPEGTDMPERTRPPKQRKPVEPEYTWGDAPPGQPELLWEHAARPLWAQALPGAGGVLLMEADRLLFRRAEDGATAWEQPSQKPPEDLAHDERGVVLATGHSLRELDPATGAVRWRHQLGGGETALALAHDTAFVVTEGPFLALDRADGRVRWRGPRLREAQLFAYPSASLVVAEDPEEEALRAFDTVSGAELWRFAEHEQPAVAGPLVGDTLLVSSHGAGAFGLEARTGAVRWRLPSEGTFESQSVLLGDAAFFTDGAAHAVDPANGDVRWTRALEDDEDRIFALRVEGDALYAESWRGLLLALDPADGSIRWERRLGQVHGSTSSGDRIFLRITTGDEPRWSVLALDARTGAEFWQLHTRRMVPDLNCLGPVLLIELRTQVLALRV